MENNKLMLTGALSFIFGGVAGFFIAKKLLDEHYQDLAQLEINDVKSYYRKKYEWAAPQLDDEEEMAGEHKELTDRYAKPSLDELTNKYKDENVEILHKEDDGWISEVEAVAPTIDEDDQTPEEEVVDEDPHLISYEEFVRVPDEEELPFKKIDLYYYRFDEVVCDINDNVTVEPTDILGLEWLDELERKTTAFVRNPEFMTDYSIHSLSKSFQTEVMARQETDRERKMRRIARQKEAMDAASAEIAEYEEEMLQRKPKTPPYVRPPKGSVRYDLISTGKTEEEEEDEQ